MVGKEALNKQIVIPAGTSIGMGKAKKNIEATIIRADEVDGGNGYFYTALYVDSKSGRPRYIPISQETLDTSN